MRSTCRPMSSLILATALAGTPAAAAAADDGANLSLSHSRMFDLPSVPSECTYKVLHDVSIEGSERRDGKKVVLWRFVARRFGAETLMISLYVSDEVSNRNADSLWATIGECEPPPSEGAMPPLRRRPSPDLPLDCCHDRSAAFRLPDRADTVAASGVNLTAAFCRRS